MAGDRFGLDGFASERVGDETGLSVDPRDAVAAMADVIDGQTLSHGAPR